MTIHNTLKTDYITFHKSIIELFNYLPQESFLKVFEALDNYYTNDIELTEEIIELLNKYSEGKEIII
jgi:FMN phosphatase YigB (HAD superfamily)